MSDDILHLLLARNSRKGCPHCLTAFRPEATYAGLGQDRNYDWSGYWMNCPTCRNMIIILQGKKHHNIVDPEVPVEIAFRAYPVGSSRPPPPNEVTETDSQVAADYVEACTVLPHSPKASAALSRRCLQNIIHNKIGVNKKDLYHEIETIIEAQMFPSYVSEQLHDVREIGKFAAHPIKSKSTGDIVPVEPGEAEWLLDTLELMFDVCYVQPAKLAERKQQIQAKINSAREPSAK